MRDERSSNAEFRAALRELATLLVYEATRNLASTDVRVITPIGPATEARSRTPTAGAGAAGRPRAWPRRRSTCCRSRRWDSSGWPETRRPTSRLPTWRRCPTPLTGRSVLVLDPMLATGGSLLHSLQAARGAWRGRRHRGVRIGRARGCSPDRRQRSCRTIVHGQCGRGPRRQRLHRAGSRRRRRSAIRPALNSSSATRNLAAARASLEHERNNGRKPLSAWLAVGEPG